MNYNWVQTFWNSLTNMSCQGKIEIFFTVAIALFAFFQWRISVKKRQDDLFKIRWKCYQEIVIKLEKKFLEACESEPYDEKTSYQQEQEDEFLRITGLNKKQYKEIVNYNLILRTRWLFDDKIADWLKNLLLDDPDEKSKFFHITFNINELGTFCVTEEFTKKFDKYLKLK